MPSKAASPYVLDVDCSESVLCERLGDDCGLLQVVLHRVQGRHYLLVKHLFRCG